MASKRRDNPASDQPRALGRKIDQIVERRPGKRDMYPYLHDLLTSPQFGIGLDVSQVVVDSPSMGMRDAPDLAIYLRAPDGQPIRTADHCVGVFEVKEGDVLGRREVPLLAEKRKYVQTGTKAFYVCDQVRVLRWDASPLAMAKSPDHAAAPCRRPTHGAPRGASGHPRPQWAARFQPLRRP